MVVLAVIGGIVLFLFLLTMIPVRAAIGFEEDFSLDIKYLFLTFHILPGKEEEPAPKEEFPKKEGEGGGKKLKAILKKHGFFGFLSALTDFVKLLAGASKRLLSHLHLKRFDLYLCLAGAEDAAQAAILYGQVSAGVYSACGVLFSLLPCKKKYVTVDLDYQKEAHQVSFLGELSIRPFFAIKEALAVLWGGLPFFKLFLGKTQ